MRRPNGAGTIVKLSGNRRRPYAVRVAQKDKYGRIVQKAIGYYIMNPGFRTEKRLLLS